VELNITLHEVISVKYSLVAYLHKIRGWSFNLRVDRPKQVAKKLWSNVTQLLWVFLLNHFSSQPQSVSIFTSESVDNLSGHNPLLGVLAPKDEIKLCCSVTTASTSHTKPQELTLTQNTSSISAKSFSVNRNDQSKQTSLNSTSFNEIEKPTEEHCKDTSVEVKEEVVTQPIVAENTEIQASILALESLLQVNPSMCIKNPILSKPQPINSSSSERIISRNNKWEIDEKRGAQATLGPVLYANICLNLKEKHPGVYIVYAYCIALILYLCLRMECKSCCNIIHMAKTT